MSTRLIMTRTGRAIGAALLGAAAVLALTGCRGDRSEKPPRQFFPDLDDQLKWKPQSQSTFFADGRTMRQPVRGTVAFGRVSFVNPPAGNEWATVERADLLKDDDAFYLGKNPDGTFVERMPVPVSKELIERGQNRFNIYCVVCHGYEGDGKGMVGRQWSTPVPNYNDPKYKFPDKNDPKIEQWKDGYIFNTARNGLYDATGLQKMPPYAHAIDERDAWAIVAYVRTLQEQHSGTMQDVPEADRAEIERQREKGLAELKAKADAEAAAKAKAPAATTPGAPAQTPPPSNPGGKQ